MAVPAFRGVRLFRALFSASLICCALPAASAPGEARAPDAAVYVASGIGVLAPVQPVPVRPAVDIRARAVPLDPMPCDLQAAEPALDNSVRGGGDMEIPGTGPGLSGEPVFPPPEAGPLNCSDPDAVGAQPPPVYSLGLESGDVPRPPVVVISGVSRPTRPWFASVSSQEGLRYGDRNWNYRSPDGPSVTVGNLNTNAPAWGSAAPLGGIQISNWAGASATLPEGSLGYSSSIGRLNLMDPNAQAGAVDYGASVGTGSVRYGLTPSLTVEGQMQSAPSLTSRGLGTTYKTAGYGTFQVGATESTFDASNAWRYRFGYSVDVADAVNLGYVNEQIGAGFGDIASYTGGVAGAPQTRNTLSAGIPISGWGTLSGTYSGLREGSALAEERLGISHSMFVAPKVQLAVGADRDIISGNYEWRANLSMPVDTFMRGTWLNW